MGFPGDSMIIIRETIIKSGNNNISKENARIKSIKGLNTVI